MKPVYLDYNATTPIAKEVADAMRPYLDEYFGNPSSIHTYGVTTKLAVEKARTQLAGLLNCEPSELIFTSGGTESNNQAIKGIALADKHKGNHIITSSIEHPAVIEVCKYLEQQGFEVTYLPVDEFGLVQMEALEKAIRKTTILITVMHANNEVGSIQPIEEIGKLAKQHGIYFHSDAAQSIGKIPVDVHAMGVDLLSIAGHKLYAPKGIGALYIRSGVKLEKLMHGADHEQNLRAGTENVLEIVGLGKAAEISKCDLEKNHQHLKETSDLLFSLLHEEFPQIRRNGHPVKCLPNTLSLSFPHVEANTLLSRLEGVAASAGAACHSAGIDVSSVLRAMQVPLELAMGTIRFSTGRETSLDDIKIAAAEIIEKANPLMQKNENQVNMSTSEQTIKLTHYTHGGGCACKIKPQHLEQVLKKLAPFTNANVLVGTETSDDAAVYYLNPEQAVVQTLDFFTPIVDDPYDFGAIAATNALSDVYAMGGKPIFALNIVGFPVDTMPFEVLEQILKGAQDKATEAGIPVLGGHSIEDPEPKYGMVVTGLIHPEKVLKNCGAQPGDALILTKQIGTGIISSGLKKGMVSEALRVEATKSMTALNKTAAEVLANYAAHACTDVTGFGLLGHLREMTLGSKCDVEIEFEKVPFFPEVKALVAAGAVPGGSKNNVNFVKPAVDFGSLNYNDQLLLADAQTSGGLLVALPKEQAGGYLNDLHQNGVVHAAIIGHFTKTGHGKIWVK